MFGPERDETEEITLGISSPHEDDYNDEEAQRKLFVGGLSWQTTEDGLKNYFESLDIGIDKVIIMRDKVTGRSRGFGFVTLKRMEDTDKAVNTRLHLGRKIEAKRAIPKRDMDNNTRKLFVGGIPINLTNVEFRQHFEKFGAVADAQIMTERQTGHSRGFGFVTFEEDEVARNTLKVRHVIQGKTVEVKKAQPKKVERQPIHIVHPYPYPYFPPYASMYAPAPVYGVPALYQPPMAYDPYFMGQPGGVIYTPHFVDTAYNSHLVHNSRVAVSPSRASTRKSTNDPYSPQLVRPLNNQSRHPSRRGTSLYARTPSTSRSSFSFYNPQERTERAWSAGPSAFNPSPSSTSNGVVFSHLSNSARKRGMSHPPIHKRTKTPTALNRRSPPIKEEENGVVHKYFQ